METLETVQMGKMEVKIFRGQEKAEYVLEGDVDENFNYSQIPKIILPKIIFKLGGLGYFNSCGVREWIFFVREFAKVPQLIMEECPVTLVDQFNIVPQTLGHAYVKSFYAPYYCSKCDEEVAYLLESSEHKESLSQHKAPVVKHTCGTVLDFDALEDCYFIHFGTKVTA